MRKAEQESLEGGAHIRLGSPEANCHRLWRPKGSLGRDAQRLGAQGCDTERRKPAGGVPIIQLVPTVGTLQLRLAGEMGRQAGTRSLWMNRTARPLWEGRAKPQGRSRAVWLGLCRGAGTGLETEAHRPHPPPRTPGLPLIHCENSAFLSPPDGKPEGGDRIPLNRIPPGNI